jgi:hypothetical protein
MHAKSPKEKPRSVSFDSDSFELLIDNGASRSITNNKKDFIDTPRLIRTIIEGYSGTSEASLVGTVTPYLMKKLKGEFCPHNTGVKR